MKLVCNGSDLSEAVSKVYKAVSSRTTSPILEGIKLKAEGKTLTLLATDLELSIEIRILADVLIEGETVVPGKFFSEFVRKLSHEHIELVLGENNQIKIKYQDSEGVLQCMNAAEYPLIEKPIDTNAFTIIKHDFRDLINKVAFAVSSDDSRPILRGALVEVEEKNIIAVALDGYRLAKCVKPIERFSGKIKVVVPARGLVEISRLLDDNSDTVQVVVMKNYLMVDMGSIVVTTRLLEGDFINYKQIIPTNFETFITVPKEEFESGIERAILLARSDKNNLVRFDIRENIMQLSSNSEIGNVVEKIIIKMTGMDLTIAFNARYFTEVMKYMDCDNIEINFINSVSPSILKTSGKDDFLYLVLPVRLMQ